MSHYRHHGESWRPLLIVQLVTAFRSEAAVSCPQAAMKSCGQVKTSSHLRVHSPDRAMRRPYPRESMADAFSVDGPRSPPPPYRIVNCFAADLPPPGAGL